MSRVASKVGFVRRYDYKRFRLTIGHSAIYAVVLAAVALAVCKFAAGSLGAFPAFLSAGPFGAVYFYNLLIYFALTIYLAVFPGMLIFDGIPTNRWNLYFKSGIGIPALIFNKLLFCVGSLLRIYALGLVPVAAVGFLTAGGTGATALEVLLCTVLGVCLVLAVVMPALFFGSFLYRRLVVGALAVVGAAASGFLLWRGGYFSASDEAAAIAAVRSLVMPAPLSLSVVAVAFLILFGLGAYLFASSRAKNYDVEELDDEALIALGVTKDMVVYERDGDDFEVAISGPEVFGLEEEQAEESEPEEDRGAKEKKPTREKKKRKRGALDDAEEAPAEEEGEL